MYRMIKAAAAMKSFPTNISEWDKTPYGWRYKLPYYTCEIDKTDDDRYNVTLFDKEHRIISEGSSTGNHSTEKCINRVNSWLSNHGRM